MSFEFEDVTFNFDDDDRPQPGDPEQRVVFWEQELLRNRNELQELIGRFEERNEEIVWNGDGAVMDALARVCFLAYFENKHFEEETEHNGRLK